MVVTIHGEATLATLPFFEPLAGIRKPAGDTYIIFLHSIYRNAQHAIENNQALTVIQPT
jgi:hypothetical protein